MPGLQSEHRRQCAQGTPDAITTDGPHCLSVLVEHNQAVRSAAAAAAATAIAAAAIAAAAVPPPLLLLQFIAPGEIVEGLTTDDPEDNPFARLFAGRQRPGSASGLLNQPLEVDLNDRRSYDRQIYDQVGFRVLPW